jgi:hypothetical protein
MSMLLSGHVGSTSGVEQRVIPEGQGRVKRFESRTVDVSVLEIDLCANSDKELVEGRAWMDDD